MIEELQNVTIGIHLRKCVQDWRDEFKESITQILEEIYEHCLTESKLGREYWLVPDSIQDRYMHLTLEQRNAFEAILNHQDLKIEGTGGRLMITWNMPEIH